MMNQEAAEGLAMALREALAGRDAEVRTRHYPNYLAWTVCVLEDGIEREYRSARDWAAGEPARTGEPPGKGGHPDYPHDPYYAANEAFLAIRQTGRGQGRQAEREAVVNLVSFLRAAHARDEAGILVFPNFLWSDDDPPSWEELVERADRRLAADLVLAESEEEGEEEG